MYDRIMLLPLATEVQVMLYGIWLLQRLQYQDVHLHSDSLLVVNMVKGAQHDTPEVHHWVVQIRDMTKTFSSFQISYIPRNRNFRADILAKKALCTNNSILWLSNFPQ